jgi:hypothetical protein
LDIDFIILFLFSYIFGQTYSEIEERKDKFVSEDFGFKYDLSEYNSRTIFMENHGVPIKTTEETIINRHNGLEDKIIRLEYNGFIVSFYEWNKISRVFF